MLKLFLTTKAYYDLKSIDFTSNAIILQIYLGWSGFLELVRFSFTKRDKGSMH